MTAHVYRVGRHLGRTLYRDDQLIGVLDHTGDAALIVHLLNNATVERGRSCVCGCCGYPHLGCACTDLGALR